MYRKNALPISRTLGAEYGGSIGLLFSLANCAGGALYIVGFAETVKQLLIEAGITILDGDEWDIRLVSVGRTLEANLLPDFRSEHTFFTVFSVYFPAATGIMAGANISGHLKNPQAAIPRGTLAAIAVSTVVYTAFALVAGATYARDADGVNEVDHDNPPDCYLNASCPFGLHNYYQAVCTDKLIPKLAFFAKGYGPGNDPRRAYALAFLITVVVVMI
ncbi:hypothetical protein TELCIR_07220, partial [Teladorsagia circumcincta]